MKCIVYNNQENRVSIVHPAPKFSEQIEMIADKDVPSGILYKILNVSDLPSREFRSAWAIEITESNSDGKGLTKNEFETKYPEHIVMAVQ